MSTDPWTGQRLDPPDTYRTEYAKCRICGETFEEDDMAEVEDGFMVGEVAKGGCKFCEKPNAECREILAALGEQEGAP